MADIFPFRGYRFDAQGAGPLHHLVTQPYDKISGDLLKEYLSRSPYNIARVIKNPDYDEAGRLFSEWIERQILRQDPQPAFYPYEQVFDVDGQKVRRLGFIGLVSLSDPELIKGHENIHEAPLQDRLNLIRKTESNDGLIFSLYSDDQCRIDQSLQEITDSSDPVCEVMDDFNVINRVWCVTDPDRLWQFSSELKERSIYIADGHHRLQTALLFAQECRVKGWREAAVESFGKRMMALFNMEAPGVRILATHRAVRDVPSFNFDRLLAELGHSFELIPAGDLDALDRLMEKEQRVLGMAAGSPARLWALVLRKEPEGFLPEVWGVARELDVNLLHEGILRPLLGIGEKELAAQSRVDYFRSREEMLRGVAEGTYQVAFLLNPTRLDQVRRISEEGQRMPQKSTDFFPKLLTGLVMMKMKIDRGQ